jgi:hypothetical protein
MKNNGYSFIKTAGCWLVLLLLMNSFTGCMYFYKVQTVKPVTSKEIHAYDSVNKYLILHKGDTAWHFSTLSLADGMLSGRLDSLPGEHLKYKTTNPKTKNRYRKNPSADGSRASEIAVLDEVHLYLRDSIGPSGKPGDSIHIPFTAFTKADIYIRDNLKTVASWVAPGLSIAIVGVAVTAIVLSTPEGPQYDKNDWKMK